jgi:hypothetical protein
MVRRTIAPEWKTNPIEFFTIVSPKRFADDFGSVAYFVASDSTGFTILLSDILFELRQTPFDAMPVFISAASRLVGSATMGINASDN